MRAWLRLILLLSLAQGSFARAQSAEAQFVSSDCDVAFAHPAEWEVVADTTRGEPIADAEEAQDLCRLLVRPRDWRERLDKGVELELYTILVRVIPKSVLEQAPSSGFRRGDSGWVVLGRHDLENPADTVSGPGWSGVRGVATLGCYGEDGQYDGLCSSPMALVGARERCIFLAGGPQSEDVLDRILATLQF